MFDVLDIELGSRGPPPSWASSTGASDSSEPAGADARHKGRGHTAKDARTHSFKRLARCRGGMGVLQHEAALQRGACAAAAAHAGGAWRAAPSLAITPAQARYRAGCRDDGIAWLATEIESGNVEYKYSLAACTTNLNRRHQLITQMKFRLSEGAGEAFYYLGVEDDGYPRGLPEAELDASIAALASMAADLSATSRLVETLPGGYGQRAALMHVVADTAEALVATDLRVAVAGSADAGKSTLVAAMTQRGADGGPLLDDGRGLARVSVFRHKHELQSGRTSSLSEQLLSYSDDGHALNYHGWQSGVSNTGSDGGSRSLDAPSVVGQASSSSAAAAASQAAARTPTTTRVVHFLDLGGAQRCMKTALYGLTCMLPDLALVCVDAATGATRITHEHLAAAVALDVPTALVITKKDTVQQQQLAATLAQLRSLLAPAVQAGSDTTAAAAAVAQCSSNVGSSTTSASHPRDNTLDATATTPLGSNEDYATPLVSSEDDAVVLAARLSMTACTTAQAVQCNDGTGSSSSTSTSNAPALFPLFVVSCVTGEGLNLLHAFLRRLQPSSLARNSAAGTTDTTQQQQQQQRQPQQQTLAAAAAAAAAGGSGSGSSSHFQVLQSYDVAGVGWVVSGVAVSGSVQEGQQLLWGPAAGGGFLPVKVSCVQRGHVRVRSVRPGQAASFALQPVAPGAPESGSTAALRAAAVAAQAAAEQEAAREAAAAVEAAPGINHGLPFRRRGGQPPTVQRPMLLRQEPPPVAVKQQEAVWLNQQQQENPHHHRQQQEQQENHHHQQQQQQESKQRQQQQQHQESCITAVQGTTSHCCHTAASGKHLAVCTRAAADKAPSATLLATAAGAAHISGYSSGAEQLGGSSEACSDDADDDSGSSPGHTGVLLRYGDKLLSSSGGVVMSRGRSGSCSSASWNSSASVGASAVSPKWHSLSSSSSSSGSSSSIGRAGHNGGRAGVVGESASSSRSTGSSISISSADAGGGSVGGDGSRHNSVSNTSDAAGSLSLLGRSPPTRSKGCVLLSDAAAARTHWQFEAQLVLLGGRWPLGCCTTPDCWPPAPPPPLHAAAERGRDRQDGCGHLDNNSTAGAALEQGVLNDQGPTCPSDAPSQTVAAAAAAVDVLGISEQQQRDQQRPGVLSGGGGKQRQSQHQQQQVWTQGKGRPQQRRRRSDFAFVVHTNGVRQTARVVHLRNLSATAAAAEAVEQADTPCQPVAGATDQSGITTPPGAAWAAPPGINAAASLLRAARGGSGADSGGGGSSSTGHAASARASRGTVTPTTHLGTLVCARLRFTHSPQWLQPGARIVLRDRNDGHVAAAGCVSCLLEPHDPSQTVTSIT